MQQPIEIFDIYEYWYTPLWHRGWFVVLVVMGILALVGYVIYRIVTRTHHKEISYFELAMAHLEHLEYAGYQPKEFYHSLTGIMKEYLSCAYSLALSDKTDHEVIGSIKEYHVSPEVVDLLEGVLVGAIRIKFAPKMKAQEHMNEDLSRCIKAVRSINRLKRLDTSDTL